MAHSSRLGLFEKACSLAIGLGFIFWCWRKRRDAKGLMDELILLPLIYLLTAPFTWAHHYVLAILPLTYLWAKVREVTRPELVALSLGTLALGTELPMYSAAFLPVGKPVSYYRGNCSLACGHLRDHLGGDALISAFPGV